MLSVEHVKKLLNDPAVSDEEAEKIRDDTRMLAELIFDSWMEDRKKAKEKNEKDRLAKDSAQETS